MDLERTGARFQTTCWTLVRAASADGEAGLAAMQQLVERTWPAVYGFLRRSGMQREEAAETTQEFFANVVFTRRVFERADPARGRLRSLLLTALKNYVKDQNRRQSTPGGERVIPLEALDHQERLIALADVHEAPESAFDRSWAASLVAEALRRTEVHYREKGRERNWSLFEARVLHPALRDREPPPMAHDADRLGFASSAEASAALQGVKRHYLSALRAVVAETVEQEEDVDGELSAIRAMLT